MMRDSLFLYQGLCLYRRTTSLGCWRRKRKIHV